MSCHVTMPVQAACTLKVFIAAWASMPSATRAHLNVSDLEGLVDIVAGEPKALSVAGKLGRILQRSAASRADFSSATVIHCSSP